MFSFSFRSGYLGAGVYFCMQHHVCACNGSELLLNYSSWCRAAFTNVCRTMTGRQPSVNSLYIVSWANDDHNDDDADELRNLIRMSIGHIVSSSCTLITIQLVHKITYHWPTTFHFHIAIFVLASDFRFVSTRKILVYYNKRQSIRQMISIISLKYFLLLLLLFQAACNE